MVPASRYKIITNKFVSNNKITYFRVKAQIMNTPFN